MFIGLIRVFFDLFDKIFYLCFFFLLTTFLFIFEKGGKIDLFCLGNGLGRNLFALVWKNILPDQVVLFMSEEKGNFKINVSAGKDAPKEFKGLTRAIILEPTKFPLAGKIVGETFKGALIGLPGYELKITGGSDKGGIPIRKDIHGPMKKRVLFTKGPCYKPVRKGIKRRKIVRGNEITEDVTQVNCIILKFGKEKIFTAAKEE
jgi:small subunit ribosomal protein S6e